MYLDEPFMKYPYMSIAEKKKELGFCFFISRQKVIRNQKATAKCY